MKLLLSVPFEQQPEQPIDLLAYAFDERGNLLNAAPLKEGRAELELPDWKGRQPRLLIAPPVPSDEKPTLDDLLKRDAYEPVWRYNPQLRVHDLLPIPADLSRLWWRCLCRVRGRVVRPISIFGFTINLPVCNARVHICEVDRLPLLIKQLPDTLIHRLRDELVLHLERPFVPNIPLPDPSPELIGPRLPLAPGLLAGFDPQPDPPVVMLNPQPEPPGLVSRVALNPQPLPPRELTAVALPPQLRASLLSPATEAVRAALIDNVRLMHPLICYWPWFWPWLRCDELTVVETDDQGRFDTLISYPCGGDRPDLYFWVEALLGGVWTTVYRPPMRCHTYWNYACGSEVTIRVHDSRVGCWPRRGPLVSVYGIGNQVAVEQVDGDGYAPGIGINAVTTPRRPFGHVLGLWADFNTAALAGAGVTHYLWSYRPSGSYPTPDTGWTPLVTPFGRRYRADFPPANSVSKLYSFEPDPAANNTFPIPPDAPWLADGASSGDWDDTSLNGIATAMFDTRTLHTASDPDKSGSYELKLELFRSDGTRVDLTAAGIDIQTWDMSTANPFDWHNILPTNRFEVGGRLVGFRMPIHVDNNPLAGEILDVHVGSAVAGECGFIEYPAGQPATIAFRASHPHNHAAFYFALTRGSSGRIEVAQAMVDALAVDPINPADNSVIDAVNRYNRSGATFTRHAPLSQLLKAECEGRAALAEELYIYATATDGWHGRLYWLDVAVPVKAFALTPEE